MPLGEPSRVGERGTVVIPAALRRRYGIEEGTLVIAEPREGGVVIRPALVLPVEVYTPERKAQFLLSNAVNAADYARAVGEVRAMGLDPDRIPHYKSPGVCGVDRLFLDANVLSSAAWRPRAALLRL
jgi:AbrB family looped-hinge helix DNA binding protein